MREPRKIKIHQSLIRPQMFLGCERELAMLSIIAALTLIFAIQSLSGTITGVIILIITLWGLRQMAKRDPRMSKKYIKSLKYKAFYYARSTPYAKSLDLKK